MSTIQNMIQYNRNFKNKKFDSINKFISDLNNYTENEQRIIHNTILNILNKKNVSNDEVNILKNIINKLSDNINTRKTSTIIFIINELYSNLFKRDYNNKSNLDELKNSLRNIDNNIIKLLLDTFERAESSVNVNITKFNKEKYYKAVLDGSIAHIAGYYRTANKQIMVIFYGREKKNGSKFESFLDPIPLEEVPNYYIELGTNNNKIEKEKFSLIKSVSGKKPYIERNGSKYKIKLEDEYKEPGEDNPIIYTKLEKTKDGNYELKDELKPSATNNISNNTKKYEVGNSVNL